MQRILFEENAERTKIIIPLRWQWGYLLTYSTLLTTWLLGTGWAVITLATTIREGQVGFQGLYLVAWLIMLLIIGSLWWYLGRHVWRRWQYYAAQREILFFYADKLVVRRPLSLLGVTDGYARAHIAPFEFDSKTNSLAFAYGSYRIPIGITLPHEEAAALRQQINERFFPDYADQEE